MKIGGKYKNIAHIVAVNMGYGHERPAHSLRSFAYDEKIVIANDYDGIPKKDKKVWRESRVWYERISRFKKVPIIGGLVFSLLDEYQRIPNFYPRRDLSSPSLQVKQFYFLIHHRNWMLDLIKKLAKNPKPLITTFMAVAFAAEEYDYPNDIYLIVTDSDMSRAWVPLNPKKTRIKYFAPTGRVAERLRLYGVPKKNIILTGFPLPQNAIGGVDSKLVLDDLKRRICNLDPNGIFISHTGQALNAYLGSKYCESLKKKKKIPLQLGFAVGGAGAQRELGIVIAKSLRQRIKKGEVILHLIAGSRIGVNNYFVSELTRIGLGNSYKEGRIKILFMENREEYFDAFSELVRELDILWTKPSELSFYTGLGLPIIMSETIGSQEDFNAKWLMQVGGGIYQLNPKYANEWLFDWIDSGALARMAWNGFIEAPTHGSYRIADVIIGKKDSIQSLPLVV